MIPEVIGDVKRLTIVSKSEGDCNDTPKGKVKLMEHFAQIVSPNNESCPIQAGGAIVSSGAENHCEIEKVVEGCTTPSDSKGVQEKHMQPDPTRSDGPDRSVDTALNITGTFTRVLKQTTTVIDLESDDCGITPENLQDRFAEVANENQVGRIFKKRSHDDDDTWHFEINNMTGFFKGKHTMKDIDEFFGNRSQEEMCRILSNAMSKSGIPKVWPMHRQVLLINPETQWSRVTLVEYGKTVMDIVCDFMPYARPNQFFAMRVNDHQVNPQSIPPRIENLNIAFMPVEALCTIVFPDENKIQCKVDVTTTFQDLACYVQYRMNLHVNNLVFFHKGQKKHPSDPVCLCDSPEFSVQHAALIRLPREPPVIMMKPEIILPPSHSDIMLAACHEEVRFAIRHPIWSSIRTVSAKIDETVECMLYRLLPDMKNYCGLSLGSQHGECLNEVLIGNLNMDGQYEVNFASNKPYPTTALEMVLACNVIDQKNIGLKGEGAENLISRWIRTPFQTKPQEKWFEGSISMCKLASKYFAHCKSQQTILALVDGKMIDPRTALQDVPSEKILTLRSCPLVGGGKEKDKDVKKILWDQFSARGVPEDLVQSRIEGFMSKVSPDKIRTHAGETWARQWVSLKQLANEAHFRLITTDGLRSYQNKKKTEKIKDNESMASTKPSSAGSSVSTRQSNEHSVRRLNLQEICLDMNYFKAAGNDVQMISIESFGPDTKGVAVMHNESAFKFLPVKRLSAEYLAIISVGSKATADCQVRMAPATNGKGEPVLVPISILNFGDVPVTFQEGSMKATLATQNAMVIEFAIYKNEVENWEDVKSPLVYMGEKIVETKTTKVLSTWAVKPYSDARKPTDHGNAEYIHGYMRVIETQADPLLARSGWFGIYLTPKNQMKRPHESYSIVAVPNKGIEHLQALVQSTKNALGIVKTNSALAVRCRREHISEIRKHIFPELPLQEEGTYAPGDKLYVLKHLESHTNTSELTQALRSLGWDDAKALKPLGPNSWSIAAPGDPPSSHVCLNSSFVVIVAQGRQGVAIKPSQDVPTTAAFIGDRSSNGVVEPPVNRFEELKHDLQGQVQALVEEKLKESTKEIHGLKQSIGQTNANIEKLKDAQAKTEVKISEVESTIHSSSESLLQRLNGMFGDLQNNICQRLDRLESPLEEKDSKRPRI